jgi:uncharacterized protein YggE
MAGLKVIGGESGMRLLRDCLRAAAFGCAVLGLAATPAIAQSGSDAHFAATTLDLGGHGETRLPPDMATIDLGVDAHAAKAAVAEAQAAAAMTRVIAVLKARGVAPADIQTSGLAVTPQYADENAAPQRPVGYLARYRLSVRV